MTELIVNQLAQGWSWALVEDESRGPLVVLTLLTEQPDQQLSLELDVPAFRQFLGSLYRAVYAVDGLLERRQSATTEEEASE